MKKKLFITIRSNLFSALYKNLVVTYVDSRNAIKRKKVSSNNSANENAPV